MSTNKQVHIAYKTQKKLTIVPKSKFKGFKTKTRVTTWAVIFGTYLKQIKVIINYKKIIKFIKHHSQDYFCGVGFAIDCTETTGSQTSDDHKLYPESSVENDRMSAELSQFVDPLDLAIVSIVIRLDSKN